MKTLSQQLIDINTEALKVIKSHMPIVISEIDKFMLNEDNDEISEEFFNSTVMFSEPVNGWENEDLYLISITGDEFKCTVNASNLYGNIYNLDIFGMTSESVLSIADFLETKKVVVSETAQFQINSVVNIANGRIENGANITEAFTWLQDDLEAIYKGEYLD